tara:strand:- start:588 stop:893 length:306 start_codon:yes stop_codon:yes gene_type:complete
MNNFFNPFDNFENEKKNIQKKEITKPTYYSQNKINNLKPYNNSVAHKYLCNTNSNKPNILNIIKTSNFSDEYSIKIIKYLYKNIKDNKNKQELIKILSDEI